MVKNSFIIWKVPDTTPDSERVLGDWCCMYLVITTRVWVISLPASAWRGTEEAEQTSWAQASGGKCEPEAGQAAWALSPSALGREWLQGVRVESSKGQRGATPVLCEELDSVNV